MTVYYVDDGGSNTSPYDTWAKAAPDIKTLDAAVAFASGDIVYFGHNTTCGMTGDCIVVGPTAGPPVLFISATQGSSPPAYQAGAVIGTTTDLLRFNGSFAIYGLTLQAAGTGATDGVFFDPDYNEQFLLQDVTLKLLVDEFIYANNLVVCKDLTIDLSWDSSAESSPVIGSGASGTGIFEINGLSFINASYRTGIVAGESQSVVISGADFSGFTNATACELYSASNASVAHPSVFSNCKTANTWVALTSDRPNPLFPVRFINVGPSDAPTSLIERVYQADLVSTTAIYRTGGAAPEGDATAWLITTESTNSEAAPYHLPWMYGTVEAGSKTFTVHITNDTADLTDAEAWLEVQYLGTSDSPLSTLASDQRASPTATAAAQTDDTTSTWNGTGPSFTYKQKLAVTATVGEAGQYRARVVIGKASVASSSYLYVDPKVVIS